MVHNSHQGRRSAYLKGTLVLTLVTVLGLSGVSLVQKLTRNQILENQRQVILNALHEVLPKDAYDNDLLDDTITRMDPDFLGSTDPVQIHRARKNGEIVAFIFHSIAPDGYQGKIHLLIGIYAGGEISHVRVTQHQETPGLGDDIDQNRSDWIFRFSGLSLEDPSEANWAVKRDGGQFDQFTGATVSPRAVVKSIHNTLLYFQANKEALIRESIPNLNTEPGGDAP